MRLNIQSVCRSQSSSRFRNGTGFTLIELMVVVGIIGILSAIALPAFNGYVLRGKQSAAKAVLLEIAHKQPMFLADRRSTYADSLAALSITVPDDVGQHYSFTVAISSPPPSYSAMAVPISDSAGSSSFHIDQSGRKLIGINGVVGTDTW